MELLYRFIAGGTIVVLITLVAQNKGPLFAGVLSMFPAIFMTTLFLVGSSAGLPVARTMAGAMIMSLPILLLFCGVFYFAASKFSLLPTLVISLTTWFIAAGIYVVVIQHYQGS